MTKITANEGGEVTRLLGEWRAGDDGALDQLMPLIYPELRAIAAGAVRSKRGEQTLQATGLVHEAFLRIVGGDQGWRDRAHFYAAAAQVMRRVLVDYFRAQVASKRGGSQVKVSLEPEDLGGDEPLRLDKLEAALQELEAMDPRKCRIAEMHYFAGMDYDAIAEALELSRSTVARELRFTRHWLSAAIDGDAPGDSAEG